MDEAINKILNRLSLTARLVIGVKCFERYCQQHTLSCESVQTLIDYLWLWPVIEGPNDFLPWESQPIALKDSAFGDALPADVVAVLKLSEVSEATFESLIEALLDIIWSSFWGAPEDPLSLENLETVFQLTNTHELPDLAPFDISLNADKEGNGHTLTAQQRDEWRQLAW